METQELLIHPAMNLMIPANQSSKPPKLNHAIEAALSTFMQQHRHHLPTDLHQLALQAIEKPLLKLIMRQTENNQSKAAKILGLNRATLHKKLVEYQLLDDSL